MEISTWRIIDGTWRSCVVGEGLPAIIHRGETEAEAIEAAQQSVQADVLEAPAKKHRFPNTLNSLRRLARKIAHR